MALKKAIGRIAGVLAAVVLGVGLSGAPSSAKADEYVQYYAVGSSSETLRQVAERFLGSAGRSTEIFNLNTGRRQPDGGSLGDPAQLSAGWYLVLPWDASGSGVQYGVLPTGKPSTGKPQSGEPSPGQPDDDSGPAGAPGPGVVGDDGAIGQGVRPVAPSAPAGGNPGDLPTTPPPAPTGKCVAATAASRPSNWAMDRLAVAEAWTVSRGTGQSVAIIDSGVDGRAAQLTRRVAVGANIVTGEGRGDSDCLGTGTAMAGLVGAEPVGKLTFAGIAPEAVLMPVRVVTDGKTPGTADPATAIEVAISANVTVIALGSAVDLRSDTVVRALKTAVDKGIVVLAPAPAAGGAGSDVPPPDGVVLVGAVTADGKAARQYAPGSVDLLAPGVNVTSIGANGRPGFVGSGDRYAVALAAGAAALVGSSHPELDAAQIAHRLTVTADRAGGAEVGLLDPVAAVTRELAEEIPSAAAPGGTVGQEVSGGDGVRIAFVITVLAGLLLSTLLVFRFRRTMRQSTSDETGEPDAADALDEDWPAAPEPAAAPH
uniref:S8 family serine peptidase n=1 Tax=Paractinoplanes polyasparticus TaxID=2856853 RepID=UPI001C844461|nr:S8 family serine peptidase [Actinoplanes polyasparticus]